ncbi:hypothetical protein, partial [Streptomyces sp. PD-S100-1]|uniref:hypothetical protein n=1 Tax=Streptomyces sp. PD-S100-1 TaxID=3394351 RepID=UPI0039BD5D15
NEDGLRVVMDVVYNHTAAGRSPVVGGGHRAFRWLLGGGLGGGGGGGGAGPGWGAALAGR